MDHKEMPKLFGQLRSDAVIEDADILKTQDGLCFIHRSLSDILAHKGIFDLPGSEGKRLACDRFFDDWFLYAVQNEEDHTYSLLKLREQEHDASDGAPADGDTPGVTISFIAFDERALLRCLADPADENRKKLNAEIDRVVARRGQTHHKALKKYFADPRSEGAYLIADTYARHIASFAENGLLPVPEAYKAIVRKSESCKSAKKWTRIPSFLRALNEKAGYAVCDHENIYIGDRDSITEHEAAAILATHAGNTSVHSFAAEVEYHARFLIAPAKIRIPFFGRSVYDSAIRADMTVDDKEFEGPAPFYREDSRIVKRQQALHRTK